MPIAYATEKQRNRMVEFAGERLEEAGLYKIMEKHSGHLLVAEKHGTTENPATIYVACHNARIPRDKLREIQNQNKNKGIFTAHLFYRDQKRFFKGVKAGEKRRKGSLKDYKPEEIAGMVELSLLERVVLEQHPMFFQYRPMLAYYIPDGLYPESICLAEMHNVKLDYSHVGNGHNAYGFVNPMEVSRTFKMPKKRMIAEGSPVYFMHNHIRGHSFLTAEMPPGYHIRQKPRQLLLFDIKSNKVI